MRVLIQDIESRNYFSRTAGWVQSPSEAEDFLVTTLAYNVAKRRAERPFQIVLHVTDTNEFIPFIEGAAWVKSQAV